MKYLKEEDFRAMVNSTATQSGKLGEAEDSPFPPAELLTVEEISAANVLLFDVDEDGRGTYQIQIQLRLTKRSV